MDGSSDSAPKVMIVNSPFDLLGGKSLFKVSLTPSSQDWNSTKFLVQTKNKNQMQLQKKLELMWYLTLEI